MSLWEKVNTISEWVFAGAIVWFLMEVIGVILCFGGLALVFLLIAVFCGGE